MLLATINNNLKTIIHFYMLYIHFCTFLHLFSKCKRFWNKNIMDIKLEKRTSL